VQPATLSPPLIAALARHYDELVDYLQRRFRDRGFARDVVHDVCVELMERPPVETVHTPLAFLRHVSTHRAIDRQRADTTRSTLIESVADTPDIHSHFEDGAYALDFKQQLQALITLIEALPPRARQCFLLHRIHGMTHEAIAAEIGVTRSMVTQHYNRAVERIAAAWAPARRYR
jgi:RNA polymerase sigma-70 factor (ECF subfamily)